MIRIKLGLVALCVSSTVASAITWDFTGGKGADAASYDFYDSTNTYKAVATGNENVYWGPQGLGIFGGGSTGIDNEGKNDQLYLDLSKSFEIVSFEILGQDGNDMVRWKFFIRERSTTNSVRGQKSLMLPSISSSLLSISFWPGRR